MTPVIDDDELLVLHKLVSSKQPVLCSAIENKDCIESLVNKGFAFRSKIKPDEPTVSATQDGRWKYTTMCANQPAGITHIPGRISKLMKIKGLL